VQFGAVHEKPNFQIANCTEQVFHQLTRSCVRDCRLLHIHAFIYIGQEGLTRKILPENLTDLEFKPNMKLYADVHTELYKP
jgi:hypothetical protein